MEKFLKINVTEGKTTIEAQGSFYFLVSAFGIAINHVYTSLKKRDKAAGEAFRELVTAFFTEADSQIWNEQPGEGFAIVELTRKEKP